MTFKGCCSPGVNNQQPLAPLWAACTIPSGSELWWEAEEAGWPQPAQDKHFLLYKTPLSSQLLCRVSVLGVALLETRNHLSSWRETFADG